MFCINCHSDNTHVTNSRPHKKDPTVWRRRRCPRCNTDFTTHEKPTFGANIYVIDSTSGAKELFCQGKIIYAIIRSFAHDEQLGVSSALPLSETVITNLMPIQGAVTTAKVAQSCYTVLQRFDKAAAMQFALRYKVVAAPRRRRKHA